MNLQQTSNLLSAINTKLVKVTCETPVKLKKTNNPHAKSKITKLQTMILQLDQKYSSLVDHVPKPSWGTKIMPNIIEYNGEHYLEGELIVKKPSVTYLIEMCDGKKEEIPFEAICEFFPSTSKQTEIKWRRINVNNIVCIFGC